MSIPFSPNAPFSPSDIEMRAIDGPPPEGFDCGAEEQNRFLYERAWRDTRRGITVTHMLFIKGMLAAYVTIMSDRIRLGPRERPSGITYQLVPAIKIAQLAVDRRFSGFGVGSFLVGYVVQAARMVRSIIGCRYITLDAQTTSLTRWYEGQGFVRNKEEQVGREQDAVRRGKNPEDIAISMRFDLRDAIEDGQT